VAWAGRLSIGIGALKRVREKRELRLKFDARGRPLVDLLRIARQTPRERQIVSQVVARDISTSYALPACSPPSRDG
jgi:hypothetical protein